MTALYKAKIADAFDNGVKSYDQHAFIQRQSADLLFKRAAHLSPKHVLEIGCGTGYLTKKVKGFFPAASITAIDIAPQMIEKCQAHIHDVDFQCHDAEEFQAEQKYDLIISNLTFQWFVNPQESIARLRDFLTPNGRLIFSALGERSFWQVHDSSYVNSLIALPQYQGQYHHEMIEIAYGQTYKFFQSLKRIGATASIKPDPLALRRLCQDVDGRHHGKVTWHLTFHEFEPL